MAAIFNQHFLHPSVHEEDVQLSSDVMATFFNKK